MKLSGLVSIIVAVTSVFLLTGGKRVPVCYVTGAPTCPANCQMFSLSPQKNYCSSADLGPLVCSWGREPGKGHALRLCPCPWHDEHLGDDLPGCSVTAPGRLRHENGVPGRGFAFVSTMTMPPAV